MSLEELMPPQITGVFRCMVIAEEEIAKAKAKHSDAELDNATFQALCPQPGMTGYSEELYRAHCREVLSQVIAGEEPRPTDAQAAICLSEVSLKFMLRREYMAAYALAMRNMFGEEKGDILHMDGVLAFCDIAGAQEVLAEVKSKLKFEIPEGV